jgi:hypothetical protein
MLKVVSLIFVIALVRSTIYFNSVISTRDSKYANFSIVVFDGIYMNTSFTVFQNYSKMLVLSNSIQKNILPTLISDLFQMTYSFMLPKNDRDRNYELTLFHSAIQSCKIAQGVRANFIVKMLMDDKKVGNFFQCPLLAKDYGFYFFKANGTFLPPVLIGRSVKFQLIVKVDGKVMSTKATVWLFTFKLQGEIRNE